LTLSKNFDDATENTGGAVEIPRRMEGKIVDIDSPHKNFELARLELVLMRDTDKRLLLGIGSI
jgi:hypothetical protein